MGQFRKASPQWAFYVYHPNGQRSMVSATSRREIEFLHFQYSQSVRSNSGKIWRM